MSHLSQNFHWQAVIQQSYKNLPMTLKIHVILDHYHDFFQWTNKAMRYKKADFTETAHSTFEMSEKTINSRFLEKLRHRSTKKWFRSCSYGIISISFSGLLSMQIRKIPSCLKIADQTSNIA